MEKKLLEEKDKVLKRIQTYKDKTKWVEIPTKDVKKQHIKLFEATEQETGIYLLKAHTVSGNITPDQLVKLNIDNNYKTRKQWETGELLDIQQFLSFSDIGINLIAYWIYILPSWIVAYREFFGLQWYEYNQQQDKHVLIFQSLNEDKLFPCDNSKYVRGECMSAMEITRDEDGMTEFTIFTYVRPCGWIPDYILPLWKEKLRDRVLLYERVAQEKYDEIYSNNNNE